MSDENVVTSLEEIISPFDARDFVAKAIEKDLI